MVVLAHQIQLLEHLPLMQAVAVVVLSLVK
jgi:hypothetical protein